MFYQFKITGPGVCCSHPGDTVGPVFAAMNQSPSRKKLKFGSPIEWCSGTQTISQSMFLIRGKNQYATLGVQLYQTEMVSLKKPTQSCFKTCKKKLVLLLQKLIQKKKKKMSIKEQAGEWSLCSTGRDCPLLESFCHAVTPRSQFGRC